jgi:hypothetical protein
MESVTSSLSNDLTRFQVPEVMLDRRLTPGADPEEEVLIKWSQMSPSLATW